MTSRLHRVGWGHDCPTDAEQIHEWYRLIKQNSTCLCDKRDGRPSAPDKVEFHHINASSKRDTLSSMAIKPYILPFRYALKPGTFAIELMKVAPLSVENHRTVHRADDKGDRQALHDRFDFDHDPFYQKEIKSFCAMALYITPRSIVEKVSNGLFDMMNAGEIIFTENSFELAADRHPVNDNRPTWLRIADL